ncbi:MAG: nicotinate-nucleotide adenylyltransferase [Pseudohongiellaceae bacterium]|nr:nicotinate-nucleotide adenylyltransferase [Pseudohongiellaceae bacterium]
MQVKPIGIMGGMFDPVHKGHLAIALEALESLNLEHVRLVPCHIPNHRQGAFADTAQRLAMLELLVKEYPGLIVDDREAARDSVSYTVETLSLIREESPDRPLVFVLGWDSFCSLPSWHRWRELFDLAHLAVMSRGGDTSSLPQELQKELQHRQVPSAREIRWESSGQCIMLDSVCVNISSTQVRESLELGENIDELVPSVVAQYIHRSGIYGGRQSV